LTEKGAIFMNKYYTIHFYIKNQYYCEMGTYHEDEFQEDLKKYRPDKLIKDDEVIQIYRCDLI
jgi:hypothetical protein